jgi:hypothetical protein
MEALDTYTSALAVLSAALLLVAAGLAKKELAWKRAKVSRRDVAGSKKPGLRVTK